MTGRTAIWIAYLILTCTASFWVLRKPIWNTMKAVGKFCNKNLSLLFGLVMAIALLTIGVTVCWACVVHTQGECQKVIDSQLDEITGKDLYIEKLKSTLNANCISVDAPFYNVTIYKGIEGSDFYECCVSDSEGRQVEHYLEHGVGGRNHRIGCCSGCWKWRDTPIYILIELLRGLDGDSGADITNVHYTSDCDYEFVGTEDCITNDIFDASSIGIDPESSCGFCSLKGHVALINAAQNKRENEAHCKHTDEEHGE